MFEVAADVIKRAKDPTDKASLRDAIIATDLNTTVGHINWKNGPMKNVCKTPLVAGQWVKGEKHPYRPDCRGEHGSRRHPRREKADRNPVLIGLTRRRRNDRAAFLRKRLEEFRGA